MASDYRGESRPRRQPTRHHIQMSAAAHRSHDVTDPFPPISSSEFPALYVRSTMRSAYRNFMRVKSPYQKSRR